MILPQVGIGLVGDLVEVAERHGRGLQVEALEGPLQPRSRLFGRSTLQGHLGGDAPKPRLLLRRVGREGQSVRDVGLGIRKPARLHFGAGQVAVDAGLEGGRAHLPRHAQGRPEGGDRLVVAAHVAIGARLVVESRDQELRIPLIDVGGLGVVLQHPLVVPGVLIDRADELQRLGLATSVPREAIEIEGRLVVLQSPLDVALDRHRIAFGIHQLSVQAGLGRLGGRHLQRLVDDRHRLLGVACAHQGLRLQPLGRGGAYRLGGGAVLGQGQRMLRSGQGGLRIAHHGRLGAINGGVERCRLCRRRRRCGGGSRSRDEGRDQSNDGRLHPNSPTRAQPRAVNLIRA